MKLKRYQKWGTLVGPTILGLWGLLTWVMDGSIIGAVLTIGAVGYWVVAFTVEPDPAYRPPNRLWLAAIMVGALALGITLSAVTR